MKNKLIILFLLLFTITSFSHQQQKSKQALPKKKVTSSGNYQRDWNKVDSLAQKGLDRSALEAVTKIYSKARIENNSSELVKAVIHRMKFTEVVDDDGTGKIIKGLEEDCKVLKFPADAVIHSMLAETYWNYYQQNRWKFLNRTETVNYKSDDLKTWDLKKILSTTVLHYQQSLAEAERLKKVPVTVFDQVLVKGSTEEARRFRPTLFDFLAHRAIDFFMAEEPGLSRPANHFKIDAAWYLNDVDMFLNFGLPQNDTSDLKYHAITLFQDLTSFHQNDAHPGALIDVNLKRLKFVHQELSIPVKDSLYLFVLQKISDRYRDYPGSTDALYEIASLYFSRGNSYKPGDVNEIRLLKKKSEQTCDSAIARFPYSQGGLNCKHLKSEINEKLLSLQVEKVNIPERPFLGRLSYANISKVYLRVVRLEKGDEVSAGLYGERLMKYYLGLHSEKEWSLELPDDGDKQTHSAEIKIGALPTGKYVILVSTSEKFSYDKNAVAYTIGWISNISYVNRKMNDGSYDLYVLNRATGQPLGNVSATVYFTQYNYSTRKYELKKGETSLSGAEGRLSMRGDEKQRSFDIEFVNGNDRLFLKDNFYQSNYESRQKTVTTSHFFTDRSIYRPGQTIYFKGIIVNSDGESTSVKANHETTVQLYDVNSQKISELNLTSNDYGTFNGTFTAPQGVLTGQMRIQNETGSRYFSVEEYKRPAFEVLFEPVKGAVMLNQKITVTGKAGSYSGAVVSDSKVQYRVIRRIRIPYWIYYWRGYMPAVPDVEIKNGTTVTGPDGKFQVTFDAVPDPGAAKETEPVFIFEVSADVTDLNGETHSESQDVAVSYKSLFLESNLDTRINRNDFKSFTIRTSNNSGVFEPARGKISIHRLGQPDRLLRARLWERPDRHTLNKTDFLKEFPFDVFEDEDRVSQWKKSEEALSMDFDTGKDSTIALDAASWKQGNYVLEVQSVDKQGQNVNYLHYFTLFSPSEGQCPVNSFAWFAPLKDKGEPGDVARFLVGSADKNVHVLYEVEWKSKIVSQQWMILNEEQKTVDIPIDEKYRGNFSVHFSFVKQCRFFHFDHLVTVPWSNKEITITTETFRDKLLPGSKETWLLKLGGKFSDKIAAEMLVSMYDASLDAFEANKWNFSAWNSFSSRLNFQPGSGFGFVTSASFAKEWNVILPSGFRTYDYLNWFGYEPGFRNKKMVYDAVSAPAAMEAQAMEGNDKSRQEETDMAQGDRSDSTALPEKNKTADVQPRTNFSETAFFFPDLITNEKNEIVFSFTIPDALTRWKFMGFAHTKELEFGMIEKQVITQKELMVVPNSPRFFREGDTISFPAKITNLATQDLSVTASISFYEALTNRNITSKILIGDSSVSISSEMSSNKGVSWNLVIPEGLGVIKYKVIARSSTFSDGEEKAVPVLSNRILVTESFPLALRNKETKSFSFEKLKNAGSTSLNHHKLTLEFTSNPAWYAIQALPYLMEYPYECSEQIFSRYYSNAIASHIVNSSWRIKGVFDLWKLQSPESFLSNLEKNQELKSAILQQTPWVLDAKDESDRKKRVALLFDLNKMSGELQSSLMKLQKKQLPNGAWSWFEGLPDDRYITQHITEGFGHLDRLGIKSVRKDEATFQMVKRALQYLDARIRDDYKRLTEIKADQTKSHIYPIQIHYLYLRSFFPDVPVAGEHKKAYDFYFSQAKKFWLENNEYLQGMIALSLSRRNEKTIAGDIINSLKERSQYSEELGRYWKNNTGGYFWSQASIETQALLIEAFHEIAGDKQAVDEMQQWLIKNKQTNEWRTTKATSEACYALLLRGTEFLAQTSLADITIGGEKIKPLSNPETKTEAGTGYFKISWNGGEIKPTMGDVKVENKNETPAWGALYWQYFEDLDKITAHETPLSLQKKIFVEQNSPSGKVMVPVSEQTPLKVGDRLKVRIELRTDRDMEYVMMTDLRASGLEPENVLSSYKIQDGLYYYESTRDVSTDFFFSKLPKGTYVFEFPLRAAQAGIFSNGLANIQCMYAPEFGAHSEGIRIEIKQ